MLGDGKSEHRKNKKGVFVLESDYLKHRKHKTASFVLGSVALSDHSESEG